ncbi:flagellar biosynthetic protein FliO [Roseomonas sp. BN140053]|uniref:flagellar biosynthetic protein FliO n=1 Tax=Roseomonas sp. BN140053 TaxID=3391898 RepID=UPI0039EBF9EF
MTNSFDPGPSTWLLSIAGLAVVLGALWLLARGARAAGLAPGAAGRRLALQESTAIDTRRRLHLVRVDGREVLILTGGGQDAVVGWLS